METTFFVNIHLARPILVSVAPQTKFKRCFVAVVEALFVNRDFD
jgi:hypothetical protein